LFAHGAARWQVSWISGLSDSVPTPAIIRSAGPADIARAAFLGAQIVRYHHSVDPKRFILPENVEQGYAWWLGQEIERPEAVVMVAELEGEIVGYCYGAIEDRDWAVLIDRHGVVHDVYVDESARRKGVARALANAVMDKLESMGVAILKVSIMVQNESAQRLVRSLGFHNTMLEFTRIRD
jgi:ribosomal protein S18 acetylase RimI-like enzyme